MTNSTSDTQRPFQIIPVLDILNEIIVRAIAGRRTEYQPIQSNLVDSHNPIHVSRAIRSTFGFNEFYVADLDAILHGSPNTEIWHELIQDGFRLMIDAGAGTTMQAIAIQTAGGVPIVGLETCTSPIILQEIVESTSGDVIFSLDLMQGQPKLPSQLGAASTVDRETNAWEKSPELIAQQAIAAGVQRMIVLDLADVGSFTGGSTDQLCCKLTERFPAIELICGGGVRRMEDLQRLCSLGIHGALVASALHDSRITAAEVLDLCGH